MKKLILILLFSAAGTQSGSADTHDITVLLGRWNTKYWLGSSQVTYRSPDIFGLPLKISAGIAGYGSLYIISDGAYEIWTYGEYGLYRDDVWRVYAGAGGIFYQNFPLKWTSFQPLLLAGVSAEIGFFNPEAYLRLRFYSDGWAVSLIQDYRFFLADWLFLTLHPRFELIGYYDFRYTELRADFFAGAGFRI
ncbi:MAG: hypothetical protein A2Y33_02770 [Spirochaetes bacterium GWF1_51_8]|nr:MAG: hypothetical protein A2Y33_02770 [Spirochaetes bacterium GWF1_51_8]